MGLSLYNKNPYEGEIRVVAVIIVVVLLTSDDISKSYVSNSVFRVLNVLTYSFFYKTATSNVDYNPHFIDEETGPQRD